MAEEDEKLLAVVQAGKFQSSVKITIPKKIADDLNITHGTFVGFWKSRKGVSIRKLR